MSESNHLSTPRTNIDLEPLLLRVGLLGAGGLLASTTLYFATVIPLIEIPMLAVIMIGLGLVSISLWGCAVLPKPHKWLRWLILAAFLLDTLLRVGVWVETQGWLTGQRLPYLLLTDSAL